jgi:hypothetical protein
MSLEPIPKGSRPNINLLAELLRSETPIPSDIRIWLADMMDENATSDFQFKVLSKRKRGAKVNGDSANWDAAKYFEELIDKGETRKRAMGKTEEKCGIKKSSINNAVASRRSAQEESDAINREFLHEELDRLAEVTRDSD